MCLKQPFWKKNLPSHTSAKCRQTKACKDLHETTECMHLNLKEWANRGSSTSLRKQHPASCVFPRGALQSRPYDLRKKPSTLTNKLPITIGAHLELIWKKNPTTYHVRSLAAELWFTIFNVKYTHSSICC